MLNSAVVEVFRLACLSLTPGQQSCCLTCPAVVLLGQAAQTAKQENSDVRLLQQICDADRFETLR